VPFIYHVVNLLLILSALVSIYREKKTSMHAWVTCAVGYSIVMPVFI
jgi:hypothetical protein